MDSYWNERALDCRKALERLDENLYLPVGEWLATHTALVLHMQLAQRAVAEDCEEWF